MLFLPLTVWLLGKNYGQVTNHKFYLKLTFRNISNPVWKLEIKKLSRLGNQRTGSTLV